MTHLSFKKIAQFFQNVNEKANYMETILHTHLGQRWANGESLYSQIPIKDAPGLFLQLSTEVLESLHDASYSPWGKPQSVQQISECLNSSNIQYAHIDEN